MISLLTGGCAVFKRGDKPDAANFAFSEQIYYERPKSLQRNQFDDASTALEALDTYYPTGAYTEQHS